MTEVLGRWQNVRQSYWTTDDKTEFTAAREAASRDAKKVSENYQSRIAEKVSQLVKQYPVKVTG